MRARYDLKPGVRSSHGRILQLAQAWPRSFRIFEVGTASGYLGKALRACGFLELVGLEADLEMAREAKPYYETLHVMDLEHATSLEELGTFDVMICADVLEHVRQPLEQLRRLSRLVRQGGHVVLSLPNAVNWTVRLMVLCGRFDYAERGLLDIGHLRFFTYRTSQRLIEDAGLRIRRVYVTPLPFAYVLEDRAPRWLASTLERLYYALCVGWRTLFAYQFVMVAERPRTETLGRGHEPPVEDVETGR